MKKLFLLTLIFFGTLSILNAQTTTEVEPQGVYKEIDVARDNQAIEILSSKNKKQIQQTEDSILSNPNYYNPPVLYALSSVLYKQDRKDEAMFWFYVAQLRARYDANLCMDNSAKDAVYILNSQFGPDINKYAFKNIDTLEKIVDKVVDFVRNNDENYDHRWINLHGLDAFGTGDSSKELSQPKDKWADIKKTTVDDYYNDFIKYVKNKKN